MDSLRKYKDFDLKSTEQADVKKLNKFENVEENKKIKLMNFQKMIKTFFKFAEK